MRPLLAVALAMAGLGLTSSVAQAATVRAKPTIQGKGIVTTTGFRCENPDPWNWSSKTCDQHSVSNDPSLEGIQMTLTASSSGHWEFVGWEGCEAKDGRKCTVGAPVGFAKNWTPTATFVDRTNPTLVSGPSVKYSESAERTVTIDFAYDEAVYAQCRIGTAEFEDCGSGEQHPLEEGDHVFEVRAWDTTGNPGGTASRGFKILDTELTAGPAEGSLTKSRTATFAYATRAGNAFRCRLDGAPLTCPNSTTTLTGLADGDHTFEVWAIHGGYADPIPAKRTWTVDGTPPTVSLIPHDATPGEGVVSSLTTATFVLGANEAVKFECSLDGAPFTTCNSPKSYNGLRSGPHRFKVRGIDKAGNVGAPEERKWSVVVPDLDSDGYNALADCNDRDATVNPGRREVLNNNADENCDGIREYDRDLDGARAGDDCDDNDRRRTPGRPEIVGNAVDEDCDGVAQRATMSVGLGANWDIYKGHTVLKGLTLNGAPRGSRVVVVCRGKSCPAKKVVLVVKNTRQKLKKFSGKKLKPGTRLTVTVSHPGYDTASKSLKIRSGKRPLIS